MHAPRSSYVLQNARETEVTLERGNVSHARASVERKNQATSTYAKLTDHMSKGMYARATTHILHVRSDEKSCARARPLFSSNFVKYFQVHFSILIAS